MRSSGNCYNTNVHWIEFQFCRLDDTGQFFLKSGDCERLFVDSAGGLCGEPGILGCLIAAQCHVGSAATPLPRPEAVTAMRT